MNRHHETIGEDCSSTSSIFRELYSKLAEKHRELPSFAELDREFEISNVVNEKAFVPSNPLAAVRRTMAHAFVFWINYLQGFLMPNPSSIVAMQDASSLDESEKEKVNQMIASLTFVVKKSYSLELEKDEKRDASFIKDAFKEWLSLKKEIKRFSEKNAEYWKQLLNNANSKKNGRRRPPADFV